MAKTGHPNFDYTCQGMWRGAVHNFSITGNHSGASFGASDAQTFMEGTSGPYAKCFAHFQSPGITIVESRYYDGQNSAPVWGAVYDDDNPAPAPLTALGDAYSGGTVNDIYLPLEVCCMLEAEVGTSKTSKPVYCRKFIRGVPVGACGNDGDQTVWDFAAAAATAVESLGNGTLYGSRVYISPTAQSAIGNWQALTEPGNHQIPRGKKKKTATTSSSTALSTIEKIIALAGGTVLAGA